MIAKQVFRSVLVLVLLGSIAIWANREYQRSKGDSAAEAGSTALREEALPEVGGDQVVMTYFISGSRCEMCRTIESLTRETAEKDFAGALADGSLVFRIIDTGEPGMGHYAKDYQLTSKTVVLSHRVDGAETEWVDMEKVWDLLDEPEEFRSYLAGGIRKYLGS